MKNKIVFICIFFFVYRLHAQTSADSLLQIMHSEKAYPERIKAYINFLEKNTLNNLDSAIAIGGEALKLARKNGDSVAVAEVKRYIGVANYFTGKYDVAASNYYAAINILEKIPASQKEKQN